MGVLKLNDISYTGGGGEGSSTLSELSDVDISSPSNGQVLKYNETSLKWENGTGGGASAMSDLTDVDLTGLEDGNSLVYDDDDDEWKVQTITKEVTQAEYDALVQAGTVEPKTAYFIKDTNGDGQDFQPIIYSDVEREIGVWRDGKPLYVKTVSLLKSDFTKANNNFLWAPASTISSNIDTIVKKDGFCKLTNYGTLNFGSTTHISDVYNSNYISFIDYYNGIALIGNSTHLNDDDGWYVYFTCQYTKTTDQAGSGTWTPQGVPAVHYSIDEQVVGTWVDGSPVYEKTFYSDNIQYTSANVYKPLITISDIGSVISMDCVASNSAHTNYRSLTILSGSSNNLKSWLFFDKTTSKGTANTLYFISEDTWATAALFVTIRYTKSSS